MGEDKNNINEQLRHALQNAFENGDFKNLNVVVSETVQKAVTEANKQVQNVSDDIKNNIRYKSKGQTHTQSNAVNQNQYASPPVRDSFHNDATFTMTNNRKKREMNRRNEGVTSLVKWKRVGGVAGILYIVFGAIGTGVLSLIFFIQLILFLVSGTTSIVGMGIVLGLLVCSILMIEQGSIKRARLRRAEKYIRLCGDQFYRNIYELAKHLGKSNRYVLKDIRKMLKLGIFQEGHLDDKGTCLMLTDKVYNEYLEVERNRELQLKDIKQQESIQQQNNNKKSNQSVAGHSDEKERIQNPELQRMIQEGNEFIRKFRLKNQEIKEEAISEKLYKLEKLLIEIFDRVEDHPEQMPQMYKFMSYYLPTTLKLVEAYAEFDSVSVPGQDILSAKKEIEKTLDTITQAFTELLNNLFMDAVFDVTTDAQVLQTMLIKEGLSKDFEKNKV